MNRLVETTGPFSSPSLNLFFSAQFPPNPELNQRLDQVLKTGEPLLIPRLAETEPACCSFICVPLLGPRGNLGVMTLVSDQIEFTGQDLPGVLHVAKATASILEATFEQERMRAEIAEMHDWISILAHELKTPLTPLNMQAGLVRRLIRTLDRNSIRSPELDRLSSIAEITDKQVHRINSLVNSLLEMTRISSGQISLKLTQVNLDQITREVVQQFTGNHGLSADLISIDSDIETRGQWDSLKIEQVLNNLISNAIKYGCGKPIRIRIRHDENSAFLEVTDQGRGIAPENREKIFMRFQRVEPCGNAPGLGLGLYISREIIRQHGGEIQVSSEVGEGSTFTVRLPLKSKSRQPNS